MEKIFQYDFSQLATFENGRAPIHLTEAQYSRAKACEEACTGFDNPVAEISDLRKTIPFLDNVFKKLSNQNDLLRVSLAAENDRLNRNEELERQVAELRADVREWVCDACSTVYPGPPQQGFACVVCLKCGGDTAPKASVTIKRLRLHVKSLLSCLVDATALARIKWGNLDADVDTCLSGIENTIANFKEGA